MPPSSGYPEGTLPFTQDLHGATSQKTAFFKFNRVKFRRVICISISFCQNLLPFVGVMVKNKLLNNKASVQSLRT
jgi:hypothetical protein